MSYGDNWRQLDEIHHGLGESMRLLCCYCRPTILLILGDSLCTVPDLEDSLGAPKAHLINVISYGMYRMSIYYSYRDRYSRNEYIRKGRVMFRIRSRSTPERSGAIRDSRLGTGTVRL